MSQSNHKPAWLLIIIIVCVLPVFGFPTMLGMISPSDEGAKTMAWFYLIYVAATAWLAWLCWPERKAVTWILLILLLMSHAAMWILTANSFQ